MISAMKAAINTSIHLSYSNANDTPLNYQEVFYLATYGGAEGKNLKNGSVIYYLGYKNIHSWASSLLAKREATQKS